jgi:hypothetical protein
VQKPLGSDGGEAGGTSEVTYEAFVPPSTTQINIHLSPSKQNPRGGGAATSIDIQHRPAPPPKATVAPTTVPPTNSSGWGGSTTAAAAGAAEGYSTTRVGGEYGAAEAAAAVDTEAKYATAASSRLYPLSDAELEKQTNSRGEAATECLPLCSALLCFDECCCADSVLCCTVLCCAAVLAALRALQNKIASLNGEKKILEDRLAEASDSAQKREQHLRFTYDAQIRQLQRKSVPAPGPGPCPCPCPPALAPDCM